MVDCFVGLGGNFENTLSVMRQVVAQLEAAEEIGETKVSRLYQTTPVSDLLQPPYLNAVCRFQTTLPIRELWCKLQKIEKMMGKKPKPKNAPRLIDLDLLFYGTEEFLFEDLIIPHPQWDKRLFVLVPLNDLADQVMGIDVKERLKTFLNVHGEEVGPLCEKLK